MVSFPNVFHFTKMPVTSKTGLLPTVGKKIKAEVQTKNLTLEAPNIAKPAYFTLKPFAGVYNPFPYGCSVLCNHPADFEAKSIVKRAKDVWATEGKSLLDLEEMAGTKYHEQANPQVLGSEPEEENVSEALFHNYTGTDSRPLTPAPTLASIATKGSQSLRVRRCVTPDPISFIPTKEKTLLVLDLRRSHSQETFFWQGGQIEESNVYDDLIGVDASRNVTPESQSQIQTKKKKTPRKKTFSTSGTISSIKTESSKDSDVKSRTHRASGSQSPSKGSVILEPEGSVTKIQEISRESSSGDLNVIKRRGKKRKGKKSGKGGKEGEKEFQGIPDPNETQVSALENQSKEESSRTSLNGEEKSLDISQAIKTDAEKEDKYKLGDKISFLNSDILRQLQRQLDQEVVDSELNLKRKLALEEALRLKSNLKQIPHGEEMKSLKKNFQFTITGSEKWLSIPRVFTRQSARFELPLDGRLLNEITPLEYVKNYVYASPERLVLYNHVFNLHKEEPEDYEETDNRLLLGKNVVEGLGKVMGRQMTSGEASEFQNLIDWKNDAYIDFRTFTGICATCERILGPKFCSKMPSQKEDPRSEIERADFEGLEEKLLYLNKIDRKLLRILKSIRDF